MTPEVAPGVLLVAPPSEGESSALTSPRWGFERAVILILDREPNGITTGIAINRRLDESVADVSALALLFVSEPDAHAFWGGPMGRDPAILAQFSAVDGLEWFHLSIRQQRPFPLPNVGVISVAEHTEPFEDRIVRARLFVGLCVWGRGQLEAEVERQAWQLRRPTADDLFSDSPERLWGALVVTA